MPNKEIKIKYEGMELIWLEIKCVQKGLKPGQISMGGPVYDEFQKYCWDNKLFPMKSTYSGPSFLYGGFKKSDAEKIMKWLDEHGAEGILYSENA